MTPDQVRLLLTGPTCMTILLSFLAVTALLAWALGRLDRLASLGERSVERLGHGRALLLVWGLAALLLTILLAGVFFTTKILALLGLVVLLLGLTLAGFGLGVSANRFGRKLVLLLSREPSPLLSLTPRPFGLLPRLVPAVRRLDGRHPRSAGRRRRDLGCAPASRVRFGRCCASHFSCLPILL